MSKLIVTALSNSYKVGLYNSDPDALTHLKSTVHPDEREFDKVSEYFYIKKTAYNLEALVNLANGFFNYAELIIIDKDNDKFYDLKTGTQIAEQGHLFK